MELYLLIGVITGAFGTGYIVYGKKNGKIVPLVSGVLLCAYMYFFDSLFWIIVIGLALMIVPFVIKYDP
jgi:membrane protein required for beta-lactamase induction